MARRSRSAHLFGRVATLAERRRPWAVSKGPLTPPAPFPPPRWSGYLPTIRLTQDQQRSMAKGRLKLQKGQWVILWGSTQKVQFLGCAVDERRSHKRALVRTPQGALLKVFE